MCRNYSSIKLRKGPLPYVLLYIFTMFLLITGMGCLIASIDPQPLPKESWWKLVIAGVFNITSGLVFLIILVNWKSLSSMFPPSTQMVNDRVCSAADLLNDTMFEQNMGYSSVNFGSNMTLESVKITNQCTMTKSPASSNNKIFCYKETNV